MAQRTAQRIVDSTMTEDELLDGITEAMTLAGWRWMHVRRSDLAVVQGYQGFPDIYAVHPGRHLALALELKTEHGQLTGEQGAWIAALNDTGGNAIVIRPADYDRILRVILDSSPAQLAILKAP